MDRSWILTHLAPFGILELRAIEELARPEDKGTKFSDPFPDGVHGPRRGSVLQATLAVWNGTRP